MAERNADQERQLRDSMNHIADRAATEAVRATLELIGIDIKDPIKAQAQFAILRELANPRTQENLRWIETIHSASEKAGEVTWRTTVKILAAAIVGLAIAMTKEYWINHIPWK